MDMNGFAGFAIERGDRSHEAERLAAICIRENIPLVTGSIPRNHVPCGRVTWCLSALALPVTPDYYPEWLADRLYRRVWRTDVWPLYRVFIKPADRYKRFTGFITNGGYRGKRRPPYWCSETISLGDEWRYYITDGKVVDSAWYWNEAKARTMGIGVMREATPAPDISDIRIPESFSGTLDFGECNNSLTLIEAQHPFACGWYGSDDKKYFQWLVNGWKRMVDRYG